jgi:hypothetical protein
MVELVLKIRNPTANRIVSVESSLRSILEGRFGFQPAPAGPLPMPRSMIGG